MKFYPKLIKNVHIQYIARYIGDVFIIYDEAGTTAEEILLDHNNMHPRMKYDMKVKRDYHISFLDLSLHRNSKEITIGIYRNPTCRLLIWLYHHHQTIQC
jgi:hypothetical protein